MISHIFFPSDLSEASKSAFKQVLELAQSSQAKVTLFHAFELLSMSVAGIYDLSITTTLKELELTMEQKAELLLGEYKQQLTQAGIETDMVIQRGHAGELIVEQAKIRGCDLIVMGSRGLGPIRSMLMGSTSTYVLHHSQCPMLVIPFPQADVQ